MRKWKYIVTLAVFIASCGSEGAQSQSKPKPEAKPATTMQDMMRAAMSRTTEIVLKENKDFCSDKHRRLHPGVHEDLNAWSVRILRDLTVEAICLDGLQRGDAGHQLALDTAMVAQTLGQDFEYENFLLSLIATSYKSSTAQQAWAYNYISVKKLELVDGRKHTGIVDLQSTYKGRTSILRERFLSQSHVLPNEQGNKR